MNALKSTNPTKGRVSGGNVGSDNVDAVLRGTTLEVYRFLLKTGKPVGVRGVQRALNLSSPSLAVYHLSKLEDAGLLTRQDGDYVVARVVLEDVVKISRFLIPRYLFYALFALAALILELTVFKPSFLTSGYFFATVVILVCVVAFCYETAKTWRKGKL
jgi:DNA-binding transcriptional ArsR family regulator